MHLGRAAGVLSLGAALAHGGLTPSHFAEWWGYGLFFLFTTVAQAILGLALLLDAFPSARDMRRVRLAGCVGNLVVAATYVASRTVGVPVFGPAAGAVEPLDPLGALTLAAELAIVGLLALDLRSARPLQ